jgi:hypothetical protein
MRTCERWRVACRKRLARGFIDRIIKGSISGRQLSLDSAEQIVVGVGAFVFDAVNEEGRRTVHAAADAALDISADALAVDVVLEVSPESHRIQSRVARMIEQRREFERLLMFKQPIVHLPEMRSILRRGGFGGLGGLASVRMFRTREVAEDEPQPLAETAAKDLHGRVGTRAERTFEVAILDQRDHRIGRSECMVRGAYGQYQMIGHTLTRVEG